MVPDEEFGPAVPASYSEDFSVKPLMWQQLVAQLGSFTVVWRPPSEESTR